MRSTIPPVLEFLHHTRADSVRLVRTKIELVHEPWVDVGLEFGSTYIAERA
jgi:hypothetical protein